jgi:hypothetical protein
MPLFAMVAFAVDLNYIWTADTELQNAADAIALKAAAELLAPNLVACLPATTPAAWDILEQQAAQNAALAAQAYAGSQRAAGSPLVVNSDDVQVGYIQDPTAAADTPAGQFQQPSAGHFPNSVQVTVRLDGSVPAGPLSLFFGPLLGTPNSARQATATATLRGQNITGFTGPGNRLLPIALSSSSYQSMFGVPTAPGGNIGHGNGSVRPVAPSVPPPPPVGVLLQDIFRVILPITGGLLPPLNVSLSPDSVPEAQAAILFTSPGDFYLVSLQNAPVGNPFTYINWILNGPSAADLATFGPNGLQATATAPVNMYAGPALDSLVEVALLLTIGQTRIVPVFNSYTPGVNPTYQVIGFLAVTVVGVNLAGLSPTITLQPTSTLDATATLGGGSGAGSAAFVYQRIALSR